MQSHLRRGAAPTGVGSLMWHIGRIAHTGSEGPAPQEDDKAANTYANNYPMMLTPEVRLKSVPPAKHYGLGQS